MIQRLKTIGIIPIKEHSERVPNKNFRDFGGVALFWHAIGILSKSGVVDEIVIDTDVPERFKNVMTLVPVHNHERPEKLRGDLVSVNKIIGDIIEHYPADKYVQTHATNPFIRPETIAEAVNMVSEIQDSLFTVTTRQARFWTAQGAPINHNPAELLRTQDLEPIFEENSAIYVFRGDAFKATGSRIGLRPCQFVLPEVEGFDIDDEDDWALAELIIAGKKALAAKSV